MYYTTQHKVLMRIFRLSERFPQAHNSAQCSLFGMDPLERASIVYTCTCTCTSQEDWAEMEEEKTLYLLSAMSHIHTYPCLSLPNQEKKSNYFGLALRFHSAKLNGLYFRRSTKNFDNFFSDSIAGEYNTILILGMEECK